MTTQSSVSTLAIVTGASRGIGRAIALELSRLGHSVAAVARDREKLNSLVSEITQAGGKAWAFTCDVGSESEVDSALKEISAAAGVGSSPLILVNNAGWGGPFHRADEVPAEEWRRIFATNVDSMAWFSKRLLPQMRLSKFGRIVNISSIQGLFGGENSSTYSASKHAMIGYTRSVAAEWGRFGVTCNAVCPGYIETEMLANYPDEKLKTELRQKIPVERFGRPEEVAALVGFLCGETAGYINGAALTMDGGLSARM